MSRGGESPRAAVLVGFMGAGKSSAGKILAGRLGADFVDVDERIERKAGRSVREIFSSLGEGAFREMEAAEIRDAVSAPGRVVAVGGGGFVDRENRRVLKEYAPVIFLDASVETVRSRLSRDGSRPLFPGADDPEGIRKLMDRRRPFYEEADFTVRTDDLSAAAVAEAILGLLASPGTPESPGSPR